MSCLKSKRKKIEVIEGEFDNETGNIALEPLSQTPINYANGETGKVINNFPIKNVMIIPIKSNP